MKTLLSITAVAAVASLAFAGTASAADMPVKAPPAAPMWTWTGFYGGVNVGGVWQSADSALSAGSGPAGPILFAPTFAVGGIPTGFSQSSSGILGGVTAGYNLQSGNVVFGIEGDFMGASLSSTSASSSALVGFPVITTTLMTKTDWLATFRGRVGAVLLPNTLFYATGGLAAGRVEGSLSIIPSGAGNSCANNAFCSVGSGSSTLVGWTAGIGAEHRLSQHLTVKIEYLHYDLGSLSYTANEAAPAAVFPLLVGPNVNVNTAVKGDIIRGGVNWLF